MASPNNFEFHNGSLRLFLQREIDQSGSVLVQLSCSPAAEQKPILIASIETGEIEKEIAAIEASTSDLQTQSTFLKALQEEPVSPNTIQTLVICLNKMKEEPIDSCDVIVVGSGAAGLASTLALQARGLKVMLVSEFGPSSLLHSAGKIAPPTVQDCDGYVGDLILEAIRLWQVSYATEHKLPLQKFGQISLAYTKEEAKNLERVADFLQEVYPYQAISLDGDVGEGLIGPLARIKTILATWQKDFISVNPEQITQKILSRIPEQLKVRARVQDVIRSGDRVRGLVTNQGPLYADHIVAATGYQWDWLPEKVLPPVRPISGAMAMLETRDPWEKPCVATPGGSILAMSQNRVWIGVSARPGDNTSAPYLEDIGKITSNAVEVCPALAQAKVVKIGSGIRPASPDGLPIVGRSALEGLYIASGCGRAGVTLMPIVGQVIAQALFEENGQYMQLCNPQRWQ